MWRERRERFRGLLEGKACVYPASVFDPLSARVAADIGFELGMFAGSTASLAILGAPDLIAITLTEFTEQAKRINRAMQLPLMVDADHGYGNAINVMRTIEECEIAGIAGLSIEDTLLPQAFGASGKAQLTPVDEGVGKMRAALAARRDAKLVIAGRTSAAAMSSVGDAIARLKAYEAVGVDASFIVGLKSRADLDTMAGELKRPLILGPVPLEMMDRDYLASRGVRVCLQGHQPIQAAVRAVYDTMRALRDGVAPGALECLPSAEVVKRVTRGADYDRWMKEFLS